MLTFSYTVFSHSFTSIKVIRFRNSRFQDDISNLNDDCMQFCKQLWIRCSLLNVCARQAPIATPVMTPMLTPGQPHHMTQRPSMPIQTPQYTLTLRPQWNSSNFPATTTDTHAVLSIGSSYAHASSSGGGGDMEPRQAVNRPPPQSASSQDWAKAAQMWVKHKTTEQPPPTAAGRATPRRTPRPGQSLVRQWSRRCYAAYRRALIRVSSTLLNVQLLDVISWRLLQ